MRHEGKIRFLVLHTRYKRSLRERRFSLERQLAHQANRDGLNAFYRRNVSYSAMLLSRSV